MILGKTKLSILELQVVTPDLTKFPYKKRYVFEFARLFFTIKSIRAGWAGWKIVHKDLV